MNAKNLDEWSVKDQVLGAISNSYNLFKKKSQDTPDFYSYGQFFDVSGQEGIYGTASAVLSLYYDDDKTNSELIKSCRDWLIRQYEDSNSLSNQNHKFNNNFKFCFFWLALYPSLEEYEIEQSHKKYYDELMSRMHSTSKGWSCSEVLETNGDAPPKTYDLYCTALALFSLRFCKDFREVASNKEEVITFLDHVNEITKEGCPVLEAKYLLSISLLLLQDLPDHLKENSKYEMEFLCRLLKLYRVRKYERGDVGKFNIPFKFRIYNGNRKDIENKYIYILSDAICLAALVKYYNAMRSIAFFIANLKTKRIFRKLTDLLLGDFKSHNSLFQPNDMKKARYSTVDHMWISFTARKIVNNLDKMRKHEKRIKTWSILIIIILIIPLMLLPFVNLLPYFYGFIIFPLVMFIFEKFRNEIFEMSEM